MFENQKILCFPGWSYSLKIKEWFGHEVECIDHFEQMDLLTDKEKIKSLLPKNEKWGLLTWSMGTWMGLSLNEIWKDNPPSFWIALAPFTNFCGENAVKEKELSLLQKSFKRKPKETLEHFRKKHGGVSVLKNEIFSDSNMHCLHTSLNSLNNVPMIKSKISCPVLILYGENDTLVSRTMVNSFYGLCTHAEMKVYGELTHELLYEEPECIKNDLSLFMNKVF